jgi:hypothetical protein
MLIVLKSINVFRVKDALLLIMKSIELLTSCIHFIVVIFRRSYDYRKTHNVYHEMLLLRRIEFDETVVQWFRVSAKYQKYEAIANRKQRRFENNIEIEIVS